jgi:hypothetical protein
VKKNSFGLLELEMADLERFWKKTPPGPLGVKNIIWSVATLLQQACHILLLAQLELLSEFRKGLWSFGNCLSVFQVSFAR